MSQKNWWKGGTHSEEEKGRRLTPTVGAVAGVGVGHAVGLEAPGGMNALIPSKR